MLKIYGRANSSNVRKVLWLCAEMDLEHDRLDYGRGFQPTDTDDYRALNPNALIPTLVDGDLVIWESNAILRYLAAKYGGEAYYPADPAARAPIDQWMDWQLTTLVPSQRALFQGLFVKDPAFTDPDLIAKALVQTTKTMGLLDAHLAESDGYVVGSSLTLADFAIAMFVHRWFALDIERAELRAVAAYYGRLSERQTFLDTIVAGGV